MENNKNVLAVLLAIIIVGGGVYLTYFQGQNNFGKNSGANSPKNATYIIEGESVILVNGVSVSPAAPGSASKVTTQYFGNEVMHDLDGDGREDTVFLLTQNMGGSGTFYYVVAALNKENGYVGGEGLLLGDRIAPQTTEMSKNPNTPNVIVVNYADRNAGESFAVRPSVGKSIWLKLDTKTMQFGQVEQNFSGEADPNRMTLGMKTWNWVSTTYNDGKTVKPAALNKFTLTFKDAKTFSATTDCNSIGGEYMINQGAIAFSKMFSTKMYCEGSQEQDFTKMLEQAQIYLFTSKGELVFDLRYDSGSMIFR